MIHWFQKAIIYHVFIDRFAGYKSNLQPTEPLFCGGSIEGILEKLQHIETMGANTIWLSPFNSSSAYHGYHITDFNEVDKSYGTKAGLQGIINQCKSKGIRVIADIVPNHCSHQHPWFIEASKNKYSPFRNWFYFDAKNNYTNFMGFDELAKLNLENDEAAEWMMNCFCGWAKLGFDGFRIDHVPGIPDAFLRELNSRLKKINPEFILIGEAWGEGMKKKYLPSMKFRGKHRMWKNGFKQIDLQKHYEGILDGVLDFGWRNLLLNNLPKIKANPGSFAKLSLTYSKKYKSDFYLPRFLDNHDTARIMHLCKNDVNLFKNLLRILFSQEQPIVIYYGTEFGLTHNTDVHVSHANSDLQARSTINWDEKAEYVEFIKKLSMQRQQRYS